MEIDRLLLGSNPFYGTDHYLGERARQRNLSMNQERMVGVIEEACKFGATGFNCSTDPLTYGLLNSLKKSGFSKKLGLYPTFPNPQGFLNEQLTHGTIGMLDSALRDLNSSSKVSAVIRGGFTLLTLDAERGMKLYADIELERLRSSSPQSSQLRAVLLHESFTDLGMCFGLGPLFKACAEHVSDKHGVIPGFVTRNLRAFVAFCESSSIPINGTLIMTPFNSLGYQMAPSREASERVLLDRADVNVIATGLLGGGLVSIDDAIGYLRTLRNTSGVAVGVSTKAHARETFSRLKGELSGVFKSS